MGNKTSWGVAAVTSATDPAGSGQTKLSGEHSQALVVKRNWLTLIFFTAVFTAACLLLFGDLGKFPLFNPDEALYAEPAREMLETGQYITTLLNYVVRYTKPPLCIWGMALCFQIFGVDEFAARFLGAACGAILVGCTYLFTARHVSKKVGLLAAFVLMTSPLYIGTAREAITDMPLSLFMAGSLLAFFHGYATRIGSWRWLAYILIGLAVMTKGPVGLVLPVAILGSYHFLRGDLPAAYRYYKPLAGFAIVALIAVPWFAVEIYQTKGAYYYEFLVRENFQRFTSVVDHKAPWFYHIAAVMGGMLPWSVFLPMALLQSLMAGWPATKLHQQIFAGPAYRRLFYGVFAELNPVSACNLFLACWFTITLAFFSVSVSKLLPYTVPAFPAAAALIAFYIVGLIANRRAWGLAVPLALLALCYAGGGMIAPLALAKLKEAPPQLLALVQNALLMLFAGAALSIALIWRRQMGLAVGLFVAVVFCSLLTFGLRGMEMASAQWEGPIPKFAHYAALSPWPIYVYHMRKPSVPFYAHRQVVIPHNATEMSAGFSGGGGLYVLGKRVDEQFLTSFPRTRVVAREGLFVLVCQQPTAFSH